MFFNLFSFFNKLKKGSSYGVLSGDYYGEILVLIKQEEENLFFVSIPNMKVRKISLEKFNIGVRNKILDFIKIVPKDTYLLLKKHADNMIRDKKIY